MIELEINDMNILLHAFRLQDGTDFILLTMKVDWTIWGLCEVVLGKHVFKKSGQL